MSDDARACVNCAHHRDHTRKEDGAHVPMCHRPGAIDLVTGLRRPTVPRTCAFERYHDEYAREEVHRARLGFVRSGSSDWIADPCGKAGKHFSPKDAA